MRSVPSFGKRRNTESASTYVHGEYIARRGNRDEKRSSLPISGPEKRLQGDDELFSVHAAMFARSPLFRKACVLFRLHDLI